MPYKYYQEISIDYTKVPADATDFPVLIAGTYTNLKTTANGGRVTNNSGFDIIFTDLANTVLPHEIESYDASTGRVAFWVKRTLSSSANTKIRMFYGNAAISTSQEDKNNVWDANYVAVYHFNTSPASTLYDSTSSPANLTTYGSMEAGDLIDAANDKAVSFVDDSSQYAQSAEDISKFDVVTGDYTMMALLKPINSGTGWHSIFGYGDGATYFQYLLSVVPTNGNIRLQSSGGGDFASSNGSKYATIGSENIIHGVRSGTTGYIYINDQSAVTGTGFNNPTTDTNRSLNVAYNDYDPSKIYTEMDASELRLSNIARSAEYITTSYNNYISPSTFYSISSEMTVGGNLTLLKAG